MGKKQRTPSARQKLAIFLRLHWLDPYPAFPHGVSGAVGLLSGFVLVVCSLLGRFSAAQSPFLLLYIVAAAVNAASGLLIANRAPAKAQARNGRDWKTNCHEAAGVVAPSTFLPKTP